MSAPSKIQKPARVLVVDDHGPMADALVAILCGHGHIAYAAYGAAEALRIAEDFHPHAFISDMNIPEMNGVELAHTVGERFPDCQMLLVSIQGYYCFLQTRGRPVRVLKKPVSLTELLEFLDACGDD